MIREGGESHHTQAMRHDTIKNNLGFLRVLERLFLPVSHLFISQSHHYARITDRRLGPLETANCQLATLFNLLFSHIVQDTVTHVYTPYIDHQLFLPTYPKTYPPSPPPPLPPPSSSPPTFYPPPASALATAVSSSPRIQNVPSTRSSCH